MSDERSILNDYDELYREASEEWSPFLAEAYRDQGFQLGNQWKGSDKSFLRAEGREAYVYNKTRTIINQISGYQKKNRLASVCMPQESRDQAKSDFASDILMYVMQKQGGYNTLSSAFEGALVTGINMMSLWMDYSQDPVNGQIKIDREPYNSFLIDPNFTKLDLSDCRYIMRRRYVDKGTAKSLIPNKASFIDGLTASPNDGKYQYMQQSRRGSLDDLLRYDELWKRTTRKVHLIIDNRTGEVERWKGSKKELDAFKEQLPFITSKSIFEPTVELNVILEDKVVFTGVDPYGTGEFPFVPALGYYTPEYDLFEYKLQGVVRGLRDAQEEYNKMRSKAADIIKSQVNSGWMVREGSVKNPNDLYKTGQGVVIERSLDSQPSDVQKMQPAELSNTFPLMINDLEGQIMALAGVSEELMGQGEGGNTEVSGTLAKQRAANSLVTLQGLFDNLNHSQKLLGEKVLKLALSNWTPEKMMKITGKEIPEGITADSNQFDIIVKQTVLTDTQETMAYYQALEAKRLGINIPDSFIIQMMPIANKTELMQAFSQEAEQAQQQQAKIIEQEEMINKMQQAKIISDLSLATERRARAEADVGLLRSRTSESIENITDAQLNRAKTITEIQGQKQAGQLQAINFVKDMHNELQEQSDRRIEAAQERSAQETLATAQLVESNPEQPAQGV